ncbi:hypothetical protein ACIQMJ_26395 [Actinosynnema sp. NPDC091369]
MADDHVARFLAGFRDLAHARSTEIRQTTSTHSADTGSVPVTRAELLELMKNGSVIVVTSGPPTRKSSPAAALTACRPFKRSGRCANAVGALGVSRTASPSGAWRACPSADSRPDRGDARPRAGGVTWGRVLGMMAVWTGARTWRS